jgi:phosphoglycerol geranylgeranyltransferase
MLIYDLFLSAKKNNTKMLAVLIDPEKSKLDNLNKLMEYAHSGVIDFFLVGSSLLLESQMDFTINYLKDHSKVPVILFPGDTYQLHPRADAILFVSLISGRNPDLLIGKHVVAAPYIKKSNLEILPTGYTLIDGGIHSSVTYMSNTIPIPANKPDIAVCTAMAGEMLGLKIIYLDAGSGANQPVKEETIRAVAQNINVPLIVGGGMKSAEDVKKAYQAGADIVVIGNALEKNPMLIASISQAKTELF